MRLCVGVNLWVEGHVCVSRSVYVGVIYHHGFFYIYWPSVESQNCMQTPANTYTLINEKVATPESFNWLESTFYACYKFLLSQRERRKKRDGKLLSIFLSYFIRWTLLVPG